MDAASPNTVSSYLLNISQTSKCVNKKRVFPFCISHWDPPTEFFICRETRDIKRRALYRLSVRPFTLPTPLLSLTLKNRSSEIERPSFPIFSQRLFRVNGAWEASIFAIERSEGRTCLSEGVIRCPPLMPAIYPRHPLDPQFVSKMCLLCRIKKDGAIYLGKDRIDSPIDYLRMRNKQSSHKQIFTCILRIECLFSQMHNSALCSLRLLHILPEPKRIIAPFL